MYVHSSGFSRTTCFCQNNVALKTYLLPPVLFSHFFHFFPFLSLPFYQSHTHTHARARSLEHTRTYTHTHTIIYSYCYHFYTSERRSLTRFSSKHVIIAKIIGPIHFLSSISPFSSSPFNPSTSPPPHLLLFRSSIFIDDYSFPFFVIFN